MKLPDSFVWHTVNVDLGDRSYDILIGPGVLTEAGKHIEAIFGKRDFFLIADSNCHDLLGHDLEAMLKGEALSVKSIVFPAGEQSKNLKQVEDISRRLVELGADRQSVILALGGGVTGDIAGFVASIYMRGIPFVQIPTTLLAQVDSSVGGKTGVDLPEGKNLVGTFYQPRLVLSDIGVLATLPQKELNNGLAEVIKYGAIWDADFFTFLEQNHVGCKNLAPEVIAYIVKRSCEIKAQVVTLDEKEGDLRRILNFGHTIGHAIEASSNFSITHGEAVAIGMVAAGRISMEKGLLAQDDFKRLTNLIKGLGLPHSVPASISPEDILIKIRHDKKAKGGKVHFVLLKGIGKTIITPEVTDEDVLKSISGSIH